MTVNVLSTSYMQSLYGGLGSSATKPASSTLKPVGTIEIPGPSLPPEPAQSAGPSPKPIGTITLPGPSLIGPSLDPEPAQPIDPQPKPVGIVTLPGPSVAPTPATAPRFQAAIQKLQEADPALVQKLQDFQTQVQNLASNGAAPSTIASTIKNDLDSLTATQRSELKTAMSSVRPRHFHHGKGMDGLMNPNSATGSAASSASAMAANATQSLSSLFGQPNTSSQSLASFLQAQASNQPSPLFAMSA